MQNDRKAKILAQRKEFEDTLALFKKHYPAVFGEEPKLLARGVIEDILNDAKLDLSKTKLRGFLGKYCSSIQYLKLHKLGATRYKLDGTAFGEVKLNEVEYAQKAIKTLEARKVKPQKPANKNKTTTLKPNYNKALKAG